jgi:CheY-like chemotaxis protein
MVKRLKVWLVDDREANRKTFVDRHANEFEVNVFETPDQVLTAFQQEDPPDALLCDIFFYPDAGQREDVEKRVENEAKRIENLSAELHADQAADGIGLIKRVRQHFQNDPPFPIYAYTSKGPYLLHKESFDRLEELNARWLFKNKYSPQIERHRISEDVTEFRERNQLTRRIWSVAWRTGLVMAIAGAILGVILDRVLKLFGV